MDQRGQYLIQIFEKIGSPLMQAILQAGDDAQGKNDAQIMAELLSKSVQTSIDLGNMIDINKSGDLSDSLRVALAGLASPIVAGQFKEAGNKVPDDEKLKRIASAMQSVLSFSQNFQPDTANIERLENLGANGASADTHQINIQTLQAFTPLVDAVTNYAFDHNPQRILPSIANKITVKANEIRQNTLGELGAADNKRIELGLLRPLVDIYCGCHTAEAMRIRNLPPEQKSELPRDSEGGTSMDPLWAMFDNRASMLEILCKTMIPGVGSGAVKPATTAPAIKTPTEQTQSGPAAPVNPADTSAPASDASGAQPPPPPSTPPQAPLEAPQETQQQSSQPAQPSTPPVEAQQQAPPPTPRPVEQPAATNQAPQKANPMSMFAKKPAASEAPPAQESPPPPPAEQPPPSAPPQASPETQQQPQTPPVEAQQQASPPNEQPAVQPADNQGADNKNPMTFFKPNKNDEDE